MSVAALPALLLASALAAAPPASAAKALADDPMSQEGVMSAFREGVRDRIEPGEPPDLAARRLRNGARDDLENEFGRGFVAADAVEVEFAATGPAVTAAAGRVRVALPLTWAGRRDRAADIAPELYCGFLLAKRAADRKPPLPVTAVRQYLRLRFAAIVPLPETTLPQARGLEASQLPPLPPPVTPIRITDRGVEIGDQPRREEPTLPAGPPPVYPTPQPAGDRAKAVKHFLDHFGPVGTLAAMAGFVAVLYLAGRIGRVLARAVRRPLAGAIIAAACGAAVGGGVGLLAVTVADLTRGEPTDERWMLIGFDAALGLFFTAVASLTNRPDRAAPTFPTPPAAG